MRLFLAIFSWLVMSSLHVVMAEELLKAPFGREWGEAPTALLEWAGKEKMDVIVELPAENPDLEIFRLQLPEGGLPGHSANAIEARFFRGRLFEVTVNYLFKDKKADEVRRAFYNTKKSMEDKLGKFSLNGRAENLDQGFLMQDESFHFEADEGLFFLMTFNSVQDTLRKAEQARFSLVYHNGSIGPPTTTAKAEVAE